MHMQMPLSFFVASAEEKAARSIVRRRVLIPTAPRLATIASPVEKYGGQGCRSPASKPVGYPASARSCLAFAGSYGCGSGGMANSDVRGTTLPGGREAPRASALLVPRRARAG